METRRTLLLDPDGWMDRRLVRLERELGLERLAEGSSQAPDVVVLDLGATALDRVRELRARWPDAILAGYLLVPDPEPWVAGQRAGCDLVANRGALVGRLRSLLRAGQGRGRRFPVAPADDLAGRLGLVARVAETPVGPVAVYHVDGVACVVEDRCPHAGAVLSDGELDGPVLTCPRHGSRFDVRTGERVRGPADSDVASHPVVVADGQVSIVLGPL